MGFFDWLLGTKEEREHNKKFGVKFDKAMSSAIKVAHSWWKNNPDIKSIPCSKCQQIIYRLQGCVLLPWQDSDLKDLEKGTEEIIEEIIVIDEYTKYKANYRFKAERGPCSILDKRPICLTCTELIVFDRLSKSFIRDEQIQNTYEKPLSHLKKTEEDIKKKTEQSKPQKSLQQTKETEKEYHKSLIKKQLEQKKMDRAERAAKRPISGLSNLRKVEEKIKKEVK